MLRCLLKSNTVTKILRSTSRDTIVRLVCHRYILCSPTKHCLLTPFS
jgi:chorismate-pyruvate lyase